ncbi:MAG: hypothetical protein WCC43_15150, partial [Pseudolabrys sp.]
MTLQRWGAITFQSGGTRCVGLLRRRVIDMNVGRKATGLVTAIYDGLQSSFSAGQQGSRDRTIYMQGH